MEDEPSTRSKIRRAYFNVAFSEVFLRDARGERDVHAVRSSGRSRPSRARTYELGCGRFVRTRRTAFLLPVNVAPRAARERRARRIDVSQRRVDCPLFRRDSRRTKILIALPHRASTPLHRRENAHSDSLSRPSFSRFLSRRLSSIGWLESEYRVRSSREYRLEIGGGVRYFPSLRAHRLRHVVQP